jgi:gamma-glutamyltranspeptidase
MAEGTSNSAVQAIRRGSDAYLYPASDKRKNGLAAGY